MPAPRASVEEGRYYDYRYSPNKGKNYKGMEGKGKSTKGKGYTDFYSDIVDAEGWHCETCPCSASATRGHTSVVHSVGDGFAMVHRGTLVTL